MGAWEMVVMFVLLRRTAHQLGLARGELSATQRERMPAKQGAAAGSKLITTLLDVVATI